MGIDRQKLISMHNPILREPDVSSPLTVGNGELAFTADVTGMQTLYEDYKDTLPLCTMSQWGWHTTPADSGRYAYTLDDLEMTEYTFIERKVYYPQEKKPGNEAVYDWLRQNPHRLNLAAIGLLYKGKPVRREQLGAIRQELHLYEGILESEYRIEGVYCRVRTVCGYDGDILAFDIESDALAAGDMSFDIRFPYGSHRITASDWEKEERHRTVVTKEAEGGMWVERLLDRDSYHVRYQGEAADIQTSAHCITILPHRCGRYFAFRVGMAREKETLEQSALLAEADGRIFEDVAANAAQGWKRFWTEGGILRLHHSRDSRATELERRIILSQYLLAVNSCGSCPPQETGLTCNSWYGKMHLEMYLWHCAWLPLWNHTDRLEKSLDWFLEHLPQARENAARNGYRGARWPKMIASEGVDCPSSIAPLLVWQQPHVIYMLEMAYRNRPSEELLHKYWVLVEETALFMTDYAVYDKASDTYNLEPPLIPVQERYRADKTRNPAFEVEYWHFALKLAAGWAERLGRTAGAGWREAAEHMAPVPEADGLYQAQDFCLDTFRQMAQDHPSMLGALGLLPSDRVKPEVMKATLDKVLECWDYGSLWGWDFAMMAMTAARLGEPEKAVDILMMDTVKNHYVASGNNNQRTRKDLPLYLPGNGGLLLAVALMAAGYEGCGCEAPGFPKDGSWTVECEGIMPFPGV